jgi:hypothetical protein
VARVQRGWGGKGEVNGVEFSRDGLGVFIAGSGWGGLPARYRSLIKLLPS